MGYIDLYFGDQSHFGLTPNVPYAWQTKHDPILLPAAKGAYLNVLGLMSRKGKLDYKVLQSTFNPDRLIAHMDVFAKQTIKRPEERRQVKQALRKQYIFSTLLRLRFYILLSCKCDFEMARKWRKKNFRIGLFCRNNHGKSNIQPTMAINKSSTKAEIIKEYKEQLDELEVLRKENSNALRKVDEAEKAVEKAKEVVAPTGKNAFAELKGWIVQEFDQMEEKLNAEREKFRTLNEAVDIEKKNLEEIHQIKAEADSLEALTLTHRREKQKQEEEIGRERDIFKEDIDEQKKKWEREKEEYEFQKKVKRRNEEDAYLQKKADQEKELTSDKEQFERERSEREAKLTAQEQEYEQMKNRVNGFKKELEEALSQQEKDLTEKLSQKHHFEMQLQNKDLEAEIQLRKEQILSLQSKVEEQREFIYSLGSKSDAASQQVKDIAMKAIENSNRGWSDNRSWERKKEKNDNTE